jgi:outer membrane lipopolysaccharide assembly protein LptE/RlpB
VVGLAACGFRLAGSDALPAILARPYLSFKDPYTDFAREFEHQLKSSGATVQELDAKSTATIEITKDSGGAAHAVGVGAQHSHRVRADLYGDLRVQGPDQELLKPQTINLSKDYSFEENELLAKEHEADILRRQMARDLVAIAMRRLTQLEVGGQPSGACVLLVNAIDRLRILELLLDRYGWSLTLVAPGEVIPGSYWGEREAGLIGSKMYARLDTPLHSVLAAEAIGEERRQLDVFLLDEAGLRQHRRRSACRARRKCRRRW